MSAAGPVLALALLQGGDTVRGFDHAKHARLFPSCLSCHEGIATAGAPLWPEPAGCAACHDGTIEARADWAPPTRSPPSNVRFEHGRHVTAVAPKAFGCEACHNEAGAARMAVRRTVVERCLQCHEIRTAHLGAPDSTCAACHRPLVEVTGFTREDVAELPEPPSHDVPGFSERAGHGAVTTRTLAANCATCHAREFCYQCHAGPAPPRIIRTLASDPRSLAIAARHRPASHGASFAETHAAPAATVPASCATCHMRTECLDCHRPSAGAGPAYHPDGFLARHPAAAYARETSCADCHNVASFCASCHALSGLVAPGPLRSGYHDAKRFFLAGHGQAARQSLESCVACHAERDCLTCHSALGGRRFNPHGPGFDANRMRRKNPEMCTACHGTAIPVR